MTCALLVADQDVPDRGRVEERVIEREDGSAGDAEHDVHAQLLQRPDQGGGTGHPGTGRGVGARRGVAAVGRVVARARVTPGPFAGRRGGSRLGRAGVGIGRIAWRGAGC